MIPLNNGSGLQGICTAVLVGIFCIQKSELLPMVVIFGVSFGFGWFFSSKILWRRFGYYYSLWGALKNPRINADLSRIGLQEKKRVMVYFYLIVFLLMPTLNFFFAKNNQMLALSTGFGISLLTFLVLDFVQEYLLKTTR